MEGVLHAASRECDLKTLVSALKTARDPNVTDADGMTALHYASWYGFAQGCSALVSAGALVNKFDHDGATPLHAAAFNNQLGCVVALVEEGADVTVSNNEGMTAAEQATKEGHLEVAAFLNAIESEQKASINLKRIEAQIAEAKEKAKAAFVFAQKAIKDAKKLVATLEKTAKKEAQNSLRSKKELEKKSMPVATPPTTRGASFSQLAGVSAPPVERVPSKPNMRKAVQISAPPSSSTSPAVSLAPTPRESVDASPLPRTMRRPSKESTDSAQPLSGPEKISEPVAVQLPTFDKDDDATMEAFMKSLDLAEILRLFDSEGLIMRDLRQFSADEFKVAPELFLCCAYSFVRSVFLDIVYHTVTGGAGERTEEDHHRSASRVLLKAFDVPKLQGSPFELAFLGVESTMQGWIFLLS
eukprot:m.299952 g.299952  ORF g.299952 m.299952 type:complete len:414 (-) comp55202_c0_seq1:53-1294(-)